MSGGSVNRLGGFGKRRDIPWLAPRAAREGGQALAVVGTQLAGSLPDGATADNLVVAYEPVWAIGTGLTPTPSDVAEMHGLIRRQLGARFGGAGQGVRILYGGSVKPA